MGRLIKDASAKKEETGKEAAGRPAASKVEESKAATNGAATAKPTEALPPAAPAKEGEKKTPKLNTLYQLDLGRKFAERLRDAVDGFGDESTAATEQVGLIDKALTALAPIVARFPDYRVGRRSKAAKGTIVPPALGGAVVVGSEYWLKQDIAEAYAKIVPDVNESLVCAAVDMATNLATMTQKGVTVSVYTFHLEPAQAAEQPSTPAA